MCLVMCCFGPAYKGIPIATTTAVALVEHHDMDVTLTALIVKKLKIMVKEGH